MSADIEAAKARLGCIVAIVVTAVALSLAVAPPSAYAADGNPMYRLYNLWSGEHFYTASAQECGDTVAAGWKYEGVGWTAPTSGDPVYRVYNSYAGEHHYTMNAAERDNLVAQGWTDEGTGWYSDANKAVPIYREYNPYMFSCNHNYTSDAAEHAFLVSLGWADESIAWYGVDVDAATLASYEEQRAGFEAQSLNGWWQSWGQSGMAWWHIVDGTLYSYMRDLNDWNLYTYRGISSVAEYRFNSDASSWIANNIGSGGYQVIVGGNGEASWLYCDNDRDNLICAMLDGKGYSGTSSRTRIADPPQALLDLASSVE